jgi:hypothetical protein
VQEQTNTSVLKSFVQIARNDDRITAMHLSVYFALYFYSTKQNSNPIQITRKEIMRFAKVSVATYHKVIRDLEVFGYISYSPSYHPALGSTVLLRQSLL